MKKILIIDDDPEIAELAKQRLEAHQYQVVMASDGEEGERIAVTQHPDMIILDIKMPKLDGYSFVKNFKHDEAHKKIPIIIMTAFANMKDLFAMEGVDHYMVKPFKAEDLVHKVNECLL